MTAPGTLTLASSTVSGNTADDPSGTRRRPRRLRARRDERTSPKLDIHRQPGAPGRSLGDGPRRERHTRVLDDRRQHSDGGGQHRGRLRDDQDQRLPGRGTARRRQLHQRQRPQRLRERWVLLRERRDLQSRTRTTSSRRSTPTRATRRQRRNDHDEAPCRHKPDRRADPGCVLHAADRSARDNPASGPRVRARIGRNCRAAGPAPGHEPRRRPHRDAVQRSNSRPRRQRLDLGAVGPRHPRRRPGDGHTRRRSGRRRTARRARSTRSPEARARTHSRVAPAETSSTATPRTLWTEARARTTASSQGRRSATARSLLGREWLSNRCGFRHPGHHVYEDTDGVLIVQAKRHDTILHRLKTEFLPSSDD